MIWDGELFQRILKNLTPAFPAPKCTGFLYLNAHLQWVLLIDYFINPLGAFLLTCCVPGMRLGGSSDCEADCQMKNEQL